MALHLMKMAVGVEDIAHLARIQALRRAQAADRGEPPLARHLTRNTPRRGEAVLDGGSIFWSIRGFLQVRQRIAALQPATDAEGRLRCAIVLHDELVRVVPRRCRAFQGWRYLEPADAPPDIGAAGADDDLPPALVAELRELGLL